MTPRTSKSNQRFIDAFVEDCAGMNPRQISEASEDALGFRLTPEDVKNSQRRLAKEAA